MTSQLLTALRLSLVEQAHNRFAGLLLLLYLPAWYAILYALTQHASIGFNLRAFHVFVATSQHRLALLTGMLNATTLIMGFVALSAVRRSAAVDRRLVLCGHSRAALILGRLAALGLGAVLVALYAVAVLAAFTAPRHPGIVAAGTFGAVLTYVAIGLVVGVVFPGDLEGFFFIIMLSLVDTFLQNPIGNPAANRMVVEFFPSYLPMQMVAGGALADRVAWWQFWGSLGWAAGLGTLGLFGFWYRTRTARHFTGVPGRIQGQAAGAR
jgi:ABC-2 type transport system permease protein